MNLNHVYVYVKLKTSTHQVKFWRIMKRLAVQAEGRERHQVLHGNQEAKGGKLFLWKRKNSKLGLLPKLLIAIVLGIIIGQFFPVWFCRVVVTASSIFSSF